MFVIDDDKVIHCLKMYNNYKFENALAPLLEISVTLEKKIEQYHLQQFTSQENAWGTKLVIPLVLNCNVMFYPNYRMDLCNKIKPME